MSYKWKNTDGYLFMISFVCMERFMGTLALRAKTWACLNEISQNKHNCAVHLHTN